MRPHTVHRSHFRYLKTKAFILIINDLYLQILHSAWESEATKDRDIDLAEDRWDFGMAAGYGLTEFLSEDGVRLVTRDDIDMAVMEDGSCLVVILRGRNLPDSC